MCIKLKLSLPRQQIQRRHLLFASQIRRRTRYTRLACCFDYVCLFVLICLILKLLFDFKLLFFCFSYFPCFFLLTFHYFLFISYLPICLYFVLFYSSGCLIAKKKVFRNPVPGGCGGGTVVFVSNKDHDRPSHNQRYIT